MAVVEYHSNIKKWLWVVLVAAVFLAYQPAWRAGFIWDDNGHVTKPELRSLQGLERIWYDLGATQQYYPLLHTAFWLEYRVFADTATGYHLVNIALHACNALLVGWLLLRLRLPNALLAAGIFALHPVMVESVAWVAELKNTLSAVFYLTALIVYVHFDTDRRWRWYLMALALFVLGLLTKTVVATLPGALLVLLWWRRGRLVWKQDVLPLVPFFALAAASGLLTAWIELKLIGATGDDFAFTLIERGLIAGRVIWFYLGKLIWPADLIFFYPRWTVDQTAGWQYLFPLGVLAGLVFLWRMRHRSRGPLAALLLFVGTLAPVLGFLNVYPFKFSFVADHFQYLASIWIIAAVAVGIDRLLPLRNPPRRGAPLTLVIYLALPAALGAMAWKQSWNYRNEEVLYRAVLEKNPRCWIAWNNLGDESVSANRRDEAIRYFEAALQIKPDYVDALINLGNALAEKQNWELATTRLQQALRFEPNSVEAHFGLGNIQYYTGHMQAAAELYRQTLQIKPDHDKALYNLGCALLQLDRPATAKPYFERALRLDPDKAGAHSGLGIALLRADRLDDATQQFQAALRIKPDDIGMRLNLAFTLNKAGRAQEAIAAYRAVLKLDPGNQPARENLAPLLGQNLPLNPGR